MTEFFATAPRGTERVLSDELRELGIARADETRGGVAFGNRLEDGYRACIGSRVASRILLPLASFPAVDADSLYAGVHAVDWTEHIDPRATLALDAAGGQSPAGPPHFIVLKAKDAIVDRLREATGSRPDVDKRDPDVRINLHLTPERVTVNLDLAGRGMHRRGIDRLSTVAPLKENLAAALLRIAGWSATRPDRPLLDPMCGSGTLLIQAAWIGLDVAPGLVRRRPGSERWLGHDPKLWKRLFAEADERREAARDRTLRIAGSDVSKEALRATRENLKRAGIAGRVRLETRELSEVGPPWDEPGIVITNPPYGARLGESGELGPLYEKLGDVLKRRFPGWRAWVFTGNPVLAKRLGLKPASRRVLHNGPIECRLIEIPISDSVPTGERGPGWRKPDPESAAFVKRLRKNLREIGRPARKAGLTCYRLYDADIPEYNLSVDWYDGAVRVEEYTRPKKVEVEVAERHLRDAMLVVPEVLDVPAETVILRVRRRREPGEQHERRAARGELREVREDDLRYLVNLTDYLDTGLFLDDRLLRRHLRDNAAGRNCLNLFAYTCTATVAMAAGGAHSTRSVDLSNTYLQWGRRNMALNGFDGEEHEQIRTDVLRWLDRGGDRKRYGLIFVAPPSYSKSKAMRRDFGVQADHEWLLRRCRNLLEPGGHIVFATNLRRFEPDNAVMTALGLVEITREITPPDFQRRPRLRAWSSVQRDAT